VLSGGSRDVGYGEISAYDGARDRPERSRAFYEALGMEFRRDLPIVRDGELEATNYFFGFPGDEPSSS
jgi:catechol 2,3-dioxygenase-like lactoylglutathione lyase family enzyme